MNRKMLHRLASGAFAGVLALLLVGSATGQNAAAQEHVAAFKKALQQNQAQLRSYEWVETTTVLLKGEVKSQKQKRCYYGADGKVQKVEISATPESQPSGGRLKRRIVKKKKEEMTDYMKKAVDLVHQYVPPESAMIQYAKDNGKAHMTPVEPNKVIRLDINDIIKTGDLMSATLNIQANLIQDINVSTWLEDNKDGIKLAVGFQQLPDGTNYSSRTTLDAPSKDIKVLIENTGHRKVN